MAWRNFQIYYMHAARTAGSANISTGTSFETSKDFLIDDRGGSLCRLGATSANQYIQIDKGSPGQAVDKLYIPAGHNLNGCTIRLESSTAAAMTSPTTMLASTAISGSSAIQYALTSSTQRYIRLTFETAGTKWAIGELILSQLKTFTIGHERWEETRFHPVEIYEKRTGARPAAEFGAKRVGYSFTCRRVFSTDLDNFLALENAVGITRPFLLDPIFDGDGTYWVSLLGPIRRELDSKNPQGELYPHYRVSLDCAEWSA